MLAYTESARFVDRLLSVAFVVLSISFCGACQNSGPLHSIVLNTVSDRPVAVSPPPLHRGPPVLIGEVLNSPGAWACYSLEDAVKITKAYQDGSTQAAIVAGKLMMPDAKMGHQHCITLTDDQFFIVAEKKQSIRGLDVHGDPVMYEVAKITLNDEKMPELYVAFMSEILVDGQEEIRQRKRSI